MNVTLTASERRMILDRLYDRFVSLGDSSRITFRAEKRRLRTERRALARLINKLEGAQTLREADL